MDASAGAGGWPSLDLLSLATTETSGFYKALNDEIETLRNKVDRQINTMLQSSEDDICRLHKKYNEIKEEVETEQRESNETKREGVRQSHTLYTTSSSLTEPVANLSRSRTARRIHNIMHPQEDNFDTIQEEEEQEEEETTKENEGNSSDSPHCDIVHSQTESSSEKKSSIITPISSSSLRSKGLKPLQVDSRIERENHGQIDNESQGNSVMDEQDCVEIIQVEEVRGRKIEDPFGDAGLYSGLLVGGRPHGQGDMQYSDGRSYNGEWQHGRWHGYGRALFANGDFYVGQYENDQRHGVGRYEWSDGRVYDGHFFRDKRQGTGTYKWPDGSSYYGEFLQGFRHGQGHYSFPDGSSYTGQFQRGKYHGIGECVWRDGRRYRGEWQGGRANGYGIEFGADGTVRHDGEWSNDRPIRRTEV